MWSDEFFLKHALVVETLLYAKLLSDSLYPPVSVLVSPNEGAAYLQRFHQPYAIFWSFDSIKRIKRLVTTWSNVCALCDDFWCVAWRWFLRVLVQLAVDAPPHLAILLSECLENWKISWSLTHLQELRPAVMVLWPRRQVRRIRISVQ